MDRPAASRRRRSRAKSPRPRASICTRSKARDRAGAWSVPLAPAAEDQLMPASQMRKTIARRLVEAKREVPHIYLTAEATVDRLLALRTEMNESGGAKISVNDLVVKALALALRRVP